MCERLKKDHRGTFLAQWSLTINMIALIQSYLKTEGSAFGEKLLYKNPNFYLKDWMCKSIEVS